VPHPIPYQGSKRILASRILEHVQGRVDRLIEPFAGSAAVTLAAAQSGLARSYVFGDSLVPLIALWQLVLQQPQDLAKRYRALWDGQREGDRTYYDSVRLRFNREGDPAALLYLLARCVKSAVRFNAAGEFNQSPDRRRVGTHPDRMATTLQEAYLLLGGQAEARCADFEELLADAGPSDVVYLDPPWQGTSGARDRRYHQGLDFDRFVGGLERLRSRGVRFLVSFDGTSGSRTYGRRLPRELGLRRIPLLAGRSSQATLIGRSEMTVESLYLSPVPRRIS
jgi:DNA adenine methylase